MENGFFLAGGSGCICVLELFFRFYFNRRPYLEWQPIVSSMIPSTKIVVLSVLFVTILIVLPFAPLFMGFSGEFFDRYSVFCKGICRNLIWWI